MLIFRYLAREVLTVMLAVSVALLLITMSSRFVKYLAAAASGSISTDVLFNVMMLRIPGFLELILPLAFFLGILLAYGRLYVESEMVVLSACGLSRHRLLYFTALTALLVALMVAALSMIISPLGAAKVQSILDDPQTSNKINTLIEGRFQKLSGHRVTYAEQIDSQSSVMKNIFMSQRRRNESGRTVISVVVARQGQIVHRDAHRYLQLDEGYRFDGSPGLRDFDVTQFRSYGQLLDEATDKERRQLEVEAKPTSSLLGSNNNKDRAALLWRLSIPITVPVVALLALGLSRTDHRRGRFVKLFPAIAIYLSYLLFLSAARSKIEEGDMLFTSAIWGIHLVYLAIGLLVYYWRELYIMLRSSPGSEQVAPA